MNIARDSENWMRCRVENQINRKYPYVPRMVSRTRWQQRLDWWTDAKQWYFSILFTIAIFTVIALLLSWFGAGMMPDPKEAKGIDFGKFVDDRCSNLATISSMSLAVIAFLLSNIAIKEPYALKLLFKRTKLAFVVIFALTSLAIFVAVSTYRFVIKPSYNYENVVLAAALTFIIVLALIGYLFIEIIVYIDPTRIDGFINEELEKDALKIIQEGLLSTLSLQAYQVVMRQANVPPFSLNSYFSGDSLRTAMRLLDPNAPKPAEPKKSYVIDVNLGELRSYLHDRKDSGLTYRPLYIGYEIDLGDNYISVPGTENTKEEKRLLKKFLIKADVYPGVETPQKIRKHHEEKLIALAENGKHKELERVLKGLESLYNMQLKYQLPRQYDVSNELPGRLNEAIRATIKEQHYRCFYLLVQFCLQTSVNAIQYDNHPIYGSLLFIYPDLYLRMLPHQADDGYLDFYSLSLDATGYYQTLLYEITGQKRAHAEKIKAINQFAYLTYSSVADLGYHIIRKHDLKRLRAVVELLESDFLDNVPYEAQIEFYRLAGKADTDEHTLEQAEEKYEDAYAFRTYRRHCMLGIKSWLLHLYRLGRIPDETAVAMNDLLSLDYGSSREALADILNIRSGKFIMYFAWQGWLQPAEKENDEPEIADSHDWLSFGFFLSQIIHFQLQLFQPLALQKINRLQLVPLINTFKGYKLEIAQNLTRWQSLLKFTDQADFDIKADRIIRVFELLAEKQEIQDLRNIANAALDKDLINKFKASALKAWKREAHAWNLFKLKGYLTEATENDAVEFIGRKGFEGQLKRFFIENDPNANANILTPMVGDTARQTDTRFFEAMLRECPIFREGMIVDLIVESLDQIRKAGYRADGIMLYSSRAFVEDAMLNDPRFKESEEGAPEFEMGRFDGVPIYYTYSYRAQNHAFVFAIDDAFELVCKVDDNFEDDFLQLEVEPVIAEDAQILAEGMAKTGSSADEIEVIKLKLLGGIYLRIGVEAAFRVKNLKAIRVGLITNNNTNP